MNQTTSKSSKAPGAFTFVLPAIYLVIAFLLAVSGAGHGPGIGIAAVLTFPAGLLTPLIGSLFENEELFVLLGLGVLQYAFVGWLIDRAVRRRSAKPRG